MNLFIHYVMGLLGLLFVLTGTVELVLLYSQPIYAGWGVISIALSIWFMGRMRRHCAALDLGFSNLEIYQHAN